MKKHVTQMTPEELDLLLSEFQKVDPELWVISRYCNKRLDERRINPFHLLELITDHRIIEYHHPEDGSHRILLRGRPHNRRELCAVFNLSNGQVVTLWTNWVGNQHQNLDWSEYDERCCILSKLKGGR